MNQRTLGIWMKVILVGLGVTGHVFYFAALPLIGQSFADAYPEFSYAYWPWLIFLWLTGVPCFAVLPLGWAISNGIARGRAFTVKNAKLLRAIGFLAAGDAAFFFIGNVAYLFCNINLVGILLGSFLMSFIGVAVAVAAFGLSSLTKNASDIREENEFTI